VSVSVLWRTILTQAITVGALFAVLLALPLPTAFFREQGVWIGPLSWLVCSLVTARLLRLSASRAVTAAIASGLAAAVVSSVAGHSAGIIAGVLVFGLVCAVRVRQPGGASPSRDVPA
jgi:uncharacterized membrane protein